MSFLVKLAIMVVAVGYWYLCTQAPPSMVAPNISGGGPSVDATSQLPSVVWMAPFYSGTPNTLIHARRVCCLRSAECSSVGPVFIPALVVWWHRRRVLHGSAVVHHVSATVHELLGLPAWRFAGSAVRLLATAARRRDVVEPQLVVQERRYLHLSQRARCVERPQAGVSDSAVSAARHVQVSHRPHGV